MVGGRGGWRERKGGGREKEEGEERGREWRGGGREGEGERGRERGGGREGEGEGEGERERGRERGGGREGEGEGERGGRGRGKERNVREGWQACLKGIHKFLFCDLKRLLVYIGVAEIAYYNC